MSTHASRTYVRTHSHIYVCVCDNLVSDPPGDLIGIENHVDWVWAVVRAETAVLEKVTAAGPTGSDVVPNISGVIEDVVGVLHYLEDTQALVVLRPIITTLLTVNSLGTRSRALLLVCFSVIQLTVQLLSRLLATPVRGSSPKSILHTMMQEDWFLKIWNTELGDLGSQGGSGGDREGLEGSLRAPREEFLAAFVEACVAGLPPVTEELDVSKPDEALYLVTAVEILEVLLPAVSWSSAGRSYAQRAYLRLLDAVCNTFNAPRFKELKARLRSQTVLRVSLVSGGYVSGQQQIMSERVSPPGPVRISSTRSFRP